MKNTQPFEDALREIGLDIAAAPGEVAVYAAQRGAYLASIAHVPGFARAAEAEADNVWLFSIRRAIRSADAADAKAWGLIYGVLLGLAT